LTEQFLDVTYASERLGERPDLLLHTIVELSEKEDCRNHEDAAAAAAAPDSSELERRLLEAVGPARRAEAAEMLSIGRLSWRLRDDDNMLLSRVESQLFRAADVALDRLRAAGRLPDDATLSEAAVPIIVEALRDGSDDPVELPAAEDPSPAAGLAPQEAPRQLVGQPAAAGLATGKVRCIRNADDIAAFQAGDVLVCDAIQPMMTHLVPLAAGIVERRGGMLIHGAIIAREMGIPCVNGIPEAVELLSTGEFVTVDGHLGIVTVGPPEFDLELR
jgi:pyruvate,water dikinase